MLSEASPFPVYVWGWGTIEDEIFKFQDQGMLNLWCPALLKMAEEIAVERYSKDKVEPELIGALVQHQTNVAVEKANQSASEKIDQNLHEKIDCYREKIWSGNFDLALEFMLSMFKGLDISVGNRVRFRLSSNIGVCYYNLGDQPNAIKYFEYAFGYDPSDDLGNANYVMVAYLRNDKALCKARVHDDLKLAKVH